MAELLSRTIGRASEKNRSEFFNRYMLLIILAIILVAGLLLSSTFFKPNNLQNVLLSVSIYGLIAIGQTAVLLVKEIDLSCGALIAFAPNTAIWLTDQFHPLIQGGNYVASGTLFIVVFTVLIGLGVGFVNGILRTKLGISSLIATLGVMYVITGATYLYYSGHSMYLMQLKEFCEFGSAKIFFIPVPVLFFIGVSVLVTFLFKRTKIGNRIYATGGNEKAAIYSGINTNRWKLIAFMFSGLCAGLAALIYCSRMQSVEAVQGSGYEMISIAIAVIGGTTLEGGRGTIFGTFVASLILCFALNIMSLVGLLSWYQTIVVGLIIVVAALQHSRIYRKSLSI